MRVLLVTKGLDIGGIERIVVDLARGLSTAGVHVEVAVVNDRRDQLIELPRDLGVTVHRLGGTDGIGWAAARRLARLVAATRFDVVHVHGPLPSIVARLVPRHRPIVTTSHTLWSGLRRPTRALWRLTARGDSATLAVSAVVAQGLPSARPVTVLPHAVDPAAVAAATARAPSPGTAESGVVAIALASHRDVKNYPNLLQAIAIARRLGANLTLVAIGEGPQLDAHRRIAAELGIAGAVRFEPPTLDPLGAMARADLLVVASDFEGQPLVVVEALALGRPVVATAVGRVPELVSPGVGRVVQPGDAEALGNALAELAGDDALRTQLGAQAARQSGAWTLDHVIAAHVALYEDVCVDQAGAKRSDSARRWSIAAPISS